MLNPAPKNVRGRVPKLSLILTLSPQGCDKGRGRYRWPETTNILKLGCNMLTPKTSGAQTRSGQEDEAMTKMRAEAAEAKVVLIKWNTPGSISPDTKEAIGKWCFETCGNDADIAAMPRPCKFPRWNYKWKLSTFPVSSFFRPV